MPAVVPASRIRTLLGSALDRSPAYLALADGLRLLVSDGRIPVGSRLPSERDLTAELALSRTTVARAYDLLRERGYLDTRRGSGSVVALPVPHRRRVDQVLSPGGVDDGRLDLSCAAPSAPAGLADAYQAAVDALPSYVGGTGYFPSGLPALQDALAQRYAARGLPTAPEQILVTVGGLGAVAVVARALTGPGDRVLVESPSYPNALAALRRTRARLVGLPVDRDGWDLDTVAATVRQVVPKAAYLIPDFHNPTGNLMTDAQREAVAGTLARTRTVAVVDETLADVVLDDVQMPAPMAAHLDDCITVGSASKAFWGGLRIGWVRAPLGRVGALVSARLSMDLGAPLLEQLALLHLLERREEVLAAHRERWVASRDAMVAALREHLPQWRFTVPAGGLALWCELPDPLASALAATAEDHGVVLPPGPSFAPTGGLERFVRLPYTHPPERLTEAVERLAPAWAEAGRLGTTATRQPPLIA